MTKPLNFVGHELVLFRVFGYHTWVDLKYFDVRPDVSDAALLTSLTAHEQYHDHYAGGDPTEQTHHCLHGPYRLEAITPGSFQAVSADSARKELMEWASSWVVQHDNGPVVEATLAAEVLPSVAGDAVFRLPDLRQTAEHDWGWVVGHSGFHEIVAVNRSNRMLTLLVASDD